VTRRRWYFVLMGVCVGLILLAWNVVRFWSTTAAVVMSVVAAVLPPTAAIVANPPWQKPGRYPDRDERRP
jgi:Mn2+/Fe2+ NRAMP family transporter